MESTARATDMGKWTYELKRGTEPLSASAYRMLQAFTKIRVWVGPWYRGFDIRIGNIGNYGLAWLPNGGYCCGAMGDTFGWR